MSQHLQHLEDGLLGLLVIRQPRQVELTPAGKTMLDCALRSELAEKRLRLQLSDPDDETGEVSLISPGSSGLAFFPMLLELKQQYRGRVMRHRFAPDIEVLEAILDNTYELGLTTLKPEDPRLNASYFTEEPLELVVPADERVRD